MKKLLKYSALAVMLMATLVVIAASLLLHGIYQRQLFDQASNRIQFCAAFHSRLAELQQEAGGKDPAWLDGKTYLDHETADKFFGSPDWQRLIPTMVEDEIYLPDFRPFFPDWPEIFYCAWGSPTWGLHDEYDNIRLNVPASETSARRAFPDFWLVSLTVFGPIVTFDALPEETVASFRKKLEHARDQASGADREFFQAQIDYLTKAEQAFAGK